jgi:hypothetical protein
MRRWVKRVAIAVCFWIGTMGFAVFTDRHPHPFALAAATAALFTVGWLCTDAFEDAETPQWTLYRVASPERTFDPRFSRLSQELDEATDRKAASRALHASLNAVAGHILLAKYDVDLGRQPEEARSILGERAWSYLDATPGDDRVVFTPLVSDVLDRLESL